MTTSTSTSTKPADCDTFTRAYIDCALWSSNDDNDAPFDDNHDRADVAPEALAAMVEDCRKFQTDNVADISGNDEQAGHDFWLTRNGHGAGFWDGDWPEDTGKRLTEACHAYGNCDLYVGDNGLIYC